MITIQSSHGTFNATDEGIVLTWTPDDDSPAGVIEAQPLDRVVRFDVEEFRQFYNESPTSVDILDIGYWLDDGTYELPALRPCEECARSSGRTTPGPCDH